MHKIRISAIEKACQIGDLAYEYILKEIRVGMKEKEIAAKLRKFIKSCGAKFSFRAIVAFGKNSSEVHHKTNNTKLIGNGEIIMLDFGVKLNGYCSDMTRTFFAGKPSAKQIKIYEVVLKAQQKAINYINLKIKQDKKIMTADVDKIAREYMVSKGFPNMPHSLGHGIGKKVHEAPHLSPKSKEILKPGMIFSIEPGIYIPDFGGVRIEDLFVLEGRGLRKLTSSPVELKVI